MDYYEFGPMNKQEMIDYLGEMKNLEIKIPELLNNALEASESYDEIIRRNSFHHPSPDDGGVIPTGSASDTVYQTYIAALSDKEREDKKVERYRAAQEKLNYVKQCIDELTDNNDKTLIDWFYVKKKPAYKIAPSLNMSKSLVYTKSKEALTRLLNKYNSNPKFQATKVEENER